ncbi:hypothetical protein IC757_08030 [Wenzhouxiangella sp. AB-CW3]|uniref:hypothetical protein n=1 Tax=Wenzhouxiangella sp. AB-CW3 TaxID=2771012 RepID=UPI00168AFA70|nr:hypothetical protein [Wenzhouxiangella sp. AB-CW3]QOC24038.1 hypothetical protein IC757_08030 [Wenzhouxiangella sp. AB-CW3]
MKNTAQLEDLMLRYGLRRRDVAELLGKPLNSAGGYSNSTVDRWLSGRNQIPDMALELLEMKLADREGRPDPWQRLIRQTLEYRDQRELEADLASVLESIAGGELPRTPKSSRPLALQRAGYLLELIAQLGGPRFKPQRDQLLNEAARLQERLNERTEPGPLRSGDEVRGETMDDLARKWKLTKGADIRRFRQLALTGHV